VNHSLPMPAAMVRRAAEFRGTPATARPAATVVLLRPRSETFQVYAHRRAAGMVFGGMYAFPGGSVDPADRVLTPAEPAEQEPDWSRRLGLPCADAAAVVGAAVREVLEETGVLIRGDLLLPWSRWITPEFEPRRFDTWFFVALLPAGQQARDISGEADHTLWLTPAEALAAYASGGFPMLPPTVVTLRELAAYSRIVDVVAASADRDTARPVVPRVEIGADGRGRLYLP
jgi:8-oxo-dGTP pyrophosphatase MutT (NUDIX family)